MVELHKPGQGKNEEGIGPLFSLEQGSQALCCKMTGKADKKPRNESNYQESENIDPINHTKSTLDIYIL